MKKLLGMILTLVLAMTCFAVAETSKQAENRYVLVRLEGETGDYLAVVGSGDGADVFDAFAPESEKFADRYAAFWEIVSKFEPAMTVQGNELNFVMTRGNSTLIQSADGETIMEADGLLTFAIVSDERVQVNDGDGLDVHVWTSVAAQSNGAALGVCPNCGKANDGDKRHVTVISAFCEEKHTQCMGDPMHHCDACGRDYVCSKSNSHTICAKCGEHWCYKDKGDHKELACGHRGCEVYGHEKEHEKCAACEGYLCDGKDHTLASCGVHHANAEGDHSAAPCGIAGHYVCDGKDHTACTAAEQPAE